MQRLLSLDISSSTIGWAIFDYDNSIVKLTTYGHFKPMSKAKSKDTLPLRLQDAELKLKDILKKYKPTAIAVEDYAKRFSRGRSQADTIILLAVFNEVCCLTAYKELGINPEKYPVTTIRSCVGKHFGTKIISKDDIFPEIVKNCSKFSVTINKIGNTKKECGDEADAIACGITALIGKKLGNITWQL